MISVVIPLCNEVENLRELCDRLYPVLKKLGNFEIIFVDDGSTDLSLEFLKNEAKKHKEIRIFSFRKNQGKAEALTFGFGNAKGELIVTLDADLQDQPEEIEKLISLREKEGFDVVAAWRKDRRDNLFKKLSSLFFNLLARSFWGLNLHDYNCGLKLYTREASKSLKLYGGMHRFIPLLVYSAGFSVGEIAVSHSPRKFGKSKYGISKIWRDLPDMFTVIFLTNYGKRPMHFFGPIGIILMLIGFMILIYLWSIQLHGVSIGRRPLLFVGFFSIISGLQIFFTGFLADLMLYISKNNSEVNYSDKNLKYSSK